MAALQPLGLDMDEIKRSIENIRPKSATPQRPQQHGWLRRKTRRKVFGGQLGKFHAELGKNVRGMRESLGMTVVQLARKLGWPLAQVLALEAGRITLSDGQHVDLMNWANSPAGPAGCGVCGETDHSGGTCVL